MPKSTYTEPQASNRISNFQSPKKDSKSAEIKTAVGVLAGAWALKNFPKVAIFGLVGVGVIIGMTLKEVAKSVDAFPRSREDLH